MQAPLEPLVHPPLQTATLIDYCVDARIDLYNTSTQAVVVGGMWLSDTLNAVKWQIPGGTTIPGNRVLRVWCDEDGTQGPMHANFKLSTGGETVVLYANAGVAVHDVQEFGQQSVDVSTGRLLDGGLPWVTFPSPFGIGETLRLAPASLVLPATLLFDGSGAASGASRFRTESSAPACTPRRSAWTRPAGSRAVELTLCP
jgi:hypothetical protein